MLYSGWDVDEGHGHIPGLDIFLFDCMLEYDSKGKKKKKKVKIECKIFMN